MRIESSLLVQKMIPCYQTFSILMSLGYGTILFRNQRNHNGHIQVVNSLNCQGYRKPRMSAWFFLAPWKTPSFIPLPTMVQLR